MEFKVGWQVMVVVDRFMSHLSHIDREIVVDGPGRKVEVNFYRFKFLFGETEDVGISLEHTLFSEDNEENGVASGENLYSPYYFVHYSKVYEYLIEKIGSDENLNLHRRSAIIEQLKYLFNRYKEDNLGGA